MLEVNAMTVQLSNLTAEGARSSGLYSSTPGQVDDLLLLRVMR